MFSSILLSAAAICVAADESARPVEKAQSAPNRVPQALQQSDSQFPGLQSVTILMHYHGAHLPRPLWPPFMMYEDGQVIYATKWKGGGEVGDLGLMTVRLTKGERKALLERINVSALEKMEAYYEATKGWDFPTTRIIVRTRTGLKWVDVYGVDGSIAPRIEHPSPFDEEYVARIRAHTPKAFLRAFDTLIAYRHPRAEPWIPETIDVLLLPTARRSGTAAWPKEWPDLKHPDVRAKKVSGILVYYVVPLSRKHWKRIQALSRKVATVRINGDFYQVRYRFRLPHDAKKAKAGP